MFDSDYSSPLPIARVLVALTCLRPRPKMRLFRKLALAHRHGFADGGHVSDWKFTQKDVREELALLHHFSFTKNQNGGEIRFLITVKEFVTPPRGQFARFFAQADRQVNQKTAPILPTGWGNSLLDALSDCARMIREFPYEGEETPAAGDSPGD